MRTTGTRLDAIWRTTSSWPASSSASTAPAPRRTSRLANRPPATMKTATNMYAAMSQPSVKLKPRSLPWETEHDAGDQRPDADHADACTLQRAMGRRQRADIASRHGRDVDELTADLGRHHCEHREDVQELEHEAAALGQPRRRPRIAAKPTPAVERQRAEKEPIGPPPMGLSGARFRARGALQSAASPPSRSLVWSTTLNCSSSWTSTWRPSSVVT